MNIEEENKKTNVIQAEIESLIQKIFDEFDFATKNSGTYTNNDLEVFKESHLKFVNKMISGLPFGYSGLDSGLPWFVYWSLNAFDIFGMDKYEFSHDLKAKFIFYLSDLINYDGGFSGYSKGLSHIISNYAAVLAIVSLHCKEAYDMIDRKAMKKYLMSMKKACKSSDDVLDKDGYFLLHNKNGKISELTTHPYGGFQVHYNGESDLRATYCAVVVAYILNIIDDEFEEGICELISKCQSHEGGLGPEPFSEAHGGYNFCGIATLLMLGKLNSINVDSQLRWLANRQMKIEGGFQGRTNKLVDSCYSFWQASVFNMLIETDPYKYSLESELLYDQLSLQAYILMACQQTHGGILDKPGKKPDLFHLNYAGAGFSLSQKTICGMKNLSQLNSNLKSYTGYSNQSDDEISISISYHDSTELTVMDPVFCLPKLKVDQAINYYKCKGPLLED